MESWKKRQIYIYGLLIAILAVAFTFGLIDAAQQESLKVLAEALVNVLGIIGLGVAAKHARPSTVDDRNESPPSDSDQLD